MSRAQPSPRRRRRWLPWLLLVIALPLAAFGALRFLLQPERLGSALLARAERATGLQLDVAQPARLAVWPRLQLELIGLRASAPEHAEPLLTAERVDVALPLALLWRRDGDMPLGELRLLRPQLDVVAAQRWLAGEPIIGPPEVPRLPRPAIAVGVVDGQLQHADWRLDAVELQLDALRERRRAELVARGVLVWDEQSLPLAVQAGATPIERADGVLLDAATLRVGSADNDPLLQLEGALQLLPQTLQVDLAGRSGPRWPTGWPALPAPADALLLERALRIGYHGPRDASGAFELALGEAAERTLLRGELAALRDWLADPAAAPLPPLDLQAALPTLELDGVELRGVSIRLQQQPSDEP